MVTALKFLEHYDQRRMNIHISISVTGNNTWVNYSEPIHVLYRDQWTVYGVNAVYSPFKPKKFKLPNRKNYRREFY